MRCSRRLTAGTRFAPNNVEYSTRSHGLGHRSNAVRHFAVAQSMSNSRSDLRELAGVPDLLE